MDDFIAKLQSRPEHHRRHITFGVSAGVTALIAILWIAVVIPRDFQNTVQAQNTPAQKKTAQAETPLGTIRQSTAAVFDGIKRIFEDSNNSISNINIEEEYKTIKNQVESGDIKMAPSPSAL